MSDLHSTKASSPTPPVGGTNTIVLASATSSGRVRIPDAWLGSFVTIQADGVKAWVAFGGIAVEVDETDVSTVDGSTFAVTASGTWECQMVPENGSIDVNTAELLRTPIGEAVYMSHKSSATGGYVRLIRSSGRVAV
jgi:hypothetical protein